MKEMEILLLSRLTKSMEDAEKNLKGNYENFNKPKRIMLRIQSDISKMLR